MEVAGALPRIYVLCGGFAPRFRADGRLLVHWP